VSAIALEAVETVRRLVLDALSNVDAAVVLFGSRATGECLPQSDIDVGVLPRKPIDRKILAMLRDRLEDLNLPYEVDVVDLSLTSEKFREVALKGAVPWRS